jgi:hypothetical protein
LNGGGLIDGGIQFSLRVGPEPFGKNIVHGGSAELDVAGPGENRVHAGPEAPKDGNVEAIQGDGAAIPNIQRHGFWDGDIGR